MAAPMGNNPPIKVDPAYYEEQHQQYQPPQEQQQQQQVNRLKRTLTLDLNRAPAFKKSKLGQQPVLSSPDLHMLKLASPELERIIMQNQNGSLTTPTPSLLFPRSVTEEQELYARGFVDALNELHHSDSSSQMDGPQAPDTPVTYTTLESQPPLQQQQQQQHNNNTSPPNHLLQGMVSSSSLSHPYVTSSCSGSTSSGASSPVGSHYAASMSPANLMGVRIKDEPQTVPSMGGGASPPVSPINMESQERIKLERKRQRNRVAASKCRRRKLERISRLEDKVKNLKGENTELSVVLNRLKEHVCQLKEQVMEHVNSGCPIMTATTSLSF
ncbi:transcription factor Jun [Neocloeon triangulifer]|uniref:transcription factor Jun n=1 Tax=Neocloeon triangulifer TaxID=2078957 RepID=UPI00286F9D2C|nr:transcription factor Jun [Neocloeon triangulifer]